MNLGSDLSSDGPDMTVEGSDLKLGSDLEMPQIQASHLKSEVRLGFSVLISGSKVSSELCMLRSLKEKVPDFHLTPDLNSFA